MDIFTENQINNALVVQSGRGGRSVRVVSNGKESGFATTTYSYSMSHEMKEYSAKRIAILMALAQGKSNSQLESLLSNSHTPQVAINNIKAI